MNKEDLKVGEYYCWNFDFTTNNSLIINKVESLNEDDIRVKHWISSSGTNYCNESNEGTLCNGCTNIRLATPEEKHWLNKCIELDKFITKEEAMKSFYPEYVKCILKPNISDGGEYIILNRIYKNINNNLNSFNNMICLQCNVTCGGYPSGNNLYTYLKYFTSSTKEEFEAQNKPKETMQKITTTIDKLTYNGNIDIPKGTTFEVIEEFKNSYQVLKPIGYDIHGKYLYLHKYYFEPQEPEFVLPDRWYIEINGKNITAINKIRFLYGTFRNSINLSHDYKYLMDDQHGIRLQGAGKKVDLLTYTKITDEQFKKYVLKEEELKQPAKDASIDEILEYCKKKYPKGTKFKVSYRPDLIYTVTGRLSKSSHVLNCIKDSKDSNPWIYEFGNYAEIVEETKQEHTKEVTIKLDSRVYSLEEITKVINDNYEKEDALEIIKTIKSIK